MTSRSFSRHTILREELLSKYEHVTFNDEGLKLTSDELIAFLNEHDKAIMAVEEIDDTILSALPQLRLHELQLIVNEILS